MEKVPGYDCPHGRILYGKCLLCEREAQNEAPTVAELQAEISKLKAELQKAKAIGALEFAAWVGPDDPFAVWDDLDTYASEKAQKFAKLMMGGAV